MTDLMLSGLVKRRALLAGEPETTQAKVWQLHADLAALDAVIRQLDPAYPVDDIATKRARAGRLEGRHGPHSAGRARQARGPFSVAAMAERVIAIRGLDAGSGAVRAAVEGNFCRALRH